MATWEDQYKLEEQSHFNRPIRNRLKNGMEFNLPQGRIATVLQNKPVNYLEAGVWTPIDKTLQLASGKYSGVGTPGVLLPTGEVQFTGKQLSHKSLGVGEFTPGTEVYNEVVDFGNGAVLDESLVWDDGVYKFTRRIIEDGVKEEVEVAVKPAGLSGELFAIETEVLDIFGDNPPSGELIGSYVSGDGTVIYPGVAWDADGEMIPVQMYVVDLPNPKRFKLYAGVPVSWMDTAVYPVVIDPTFSVQPDATAGFDNRIQNNLPNNNYGTATVMASGETLSGATTYRALIKFDLSSIPSNAVISTATFSLYDYFHDASNVRTARCYRILRDWTETGSTWNNWKSGNAWTTAGCGSAGNDYASGDIGNLSYDVAAAKWRDFPMTASGIEDFVNGTNPNYGWIVRMDTEVNDYHDHRTSDFGTASFRPKIEIVWVRRGGGSPYFF